MDAEGLEGERSKIFPSAHRNKARSHTLPQRARVHWQLSFNGLVRVCKRANNIHGKGAAGSLVRCSIYTDAEATSLSIVARDAYVFSSQR